MRLMICTLALLPFSAFAQTATEEVTPLQSAPSCAVGTVWDSTSQSCVLAEQNITPLQSHPDGYSCGGTAKSVTS